MNVKTLSKPRTDSKVRSEHGWFTAIFRAHTLRKTTAKQLARYLGWHHRTISALLDGSQGRHVERAVELLASNPALANECFARFGLGGLHYIDAETCVYELHAELSDLDADITKARRGDNVIDHQEWAGLAPKIAAVAIKAASVKGRRAAA